MDMAGLALCVALLVGVGLIWRIIRVNAELRSLRAGLEDLQALSDAEQIFARSVGERRWSVIRGGKVIAVVFAAGCAALKRTHVVQAAAAGTTVAAGTLALATSTGTLHPPDPSIAGADPTTTPPPAVVVEPAPEVVTVREVVTIEVSPLSLVPPPTVPLPTTLKPTAPTSSTTSSTSTTSTTLLDLDVTTTTAVTLPDPPGDEDPIDPDGRGVDLPGLLTLPWHPPANLLSGSAGYG